MLDKTYYWWVVFGVVLAFGMKKETILEVPCPDLSQIGSIIGTLTLYKECVALMLWDYSYVNIWVMLEEGIWVKQLSVGPLQGLVWPLGFWENKGRLQGFVWPLGFWENKGLLLICNDSEPNLLNPNSQMVLYGVGTEEIRAVEPKAMDIHFRALAYYESLISVDGRPESEGKYDLLNTVSGFLNNDPSR